MNEDNAFLAPKSGRHLFSIPRAAILLALAFVSILLMSAGRAKAADCTEPQACYTAGTWEKAISDDYSNKAAWFRATSKQNFANAYEWNQKATFAFHAGDGYAAQWYKAVADDYSKKSVADAKAASDYANQAFFWATAANRDFKRYIFITSSVEEIGSVTEIARAGGGGRLEKAKQICKAKWVNHVCDYVKTKVIDEVARYVWKMLNGSTCLRQQTRYDVNPSSGYVTRVWHQCVKWA